MANSMAEILSPFVWGASGTKLTPDQIEQQRRVAEALSRNSNPAFQNAGMLGVIGQGLEGAYSGWQNTQLDRAEADNNSYNQTLSQELLGGGVPSVATQTSATSPAPAVASGGGSYRDAIASIESAGSGDYSAVGPTHPTMGRALGRYQIMESNIGPWSQAALGRAVTPEEFMANPQLQDAIFDNQFGKYVQKYGPEGAAQAWLGGEGGVGKVDRKDSLGTSIGTYGQRFMSALAPQNATDAISAQMAPPREVGPTPGSNMPMVAQAEPAQTAIPGMNEAIVRAMTDPRANSQTKAIAQILMQQQMARQQAQQEMLAKQADPAYQIGLEKARLELEGLRNPQVKVPDSVQALDLRAQRAGLQPGTPEYRDFMVSGGSKGQNITVNTGEGNKFYNTLDEANAKIFSGLSDTGMQARSKLGQIDQLENLINASPTGAVAALKQAAGEYGINTSGLSDLQAATALINQLVPQQRAPGSGSMSDQDLALFKQSLPRLINQPGGNQTILNTMRGITQYQIQTGEIADKIANREITPAEGRKMIADLPNPLSNFKPPPAGKEDEGWKELAPGIRVRKVN